MAIGTINALTGSWINWFLADISSSIWTFLFFPWTTTTSMFKCKKVCLKIKWRVKLWPCLLWELHWCGAQDHVLVRIPEQKEESLFSFDSFFWCSNSYRLKDPLMSCLKALKQTTVFSDSSGTCISLHFSTFLLAFCHQRFLQEKRIIIIINFKEVICSCFISLFPETIICCLWHQIFAVVATQK